MFVLLLVEGNKPFPYISLPSPLQPLVVPLLAPLLALYSVLLRVLRCVCYVACVAYAACVLYVVLCYWCCVACQVACCVVRRVVPCPVRKTQRRSTINSTQDTTTRRYIPTTHLVSLSLLFYILFTKRIYYHKYWTPI